MASMPNFWFKTKQSVLLLACIIFDWKLLRHPIPKNCASFAETKLESKDYKLKFD